METGDKSERLQLLKELRLGIRDADAGRLKPFDEVVVERIKREGRKRVAKRTSETERRRAPRQ
jgi:hypothetical protein